MDNCPHQTSQASSAVPLGDEKDRDTQKAHFAVFAFLLAAGVLFHNFQLGDWHVWSRTTVLSCVSLWVMLRPGDARRFLLLAALFGASFAIDLPFVVNHWMFVALALATIPLVMLVDRRGRAWLDSGGLLYQRIAPVLRCQVILLYAFATLHKANHAFIDPERSAAVGMYNTLADTVPFLPQAEWLEGPVIYGTLVIEGLLAVLLLVRRTRIAALGLAVAFHVVLAVAGHVAFSGFAFALLWPFAPADMPKRFVRVRQQSPGCQRLSHATEAIARSPRTLPILCAVYLTVSLVHTTDLIGGPWFGYLINHGALALYLLYALTLTMLTLLCLRVASIPRLSNHALRPDHPLLWLGVAVVFLNGMCPYLGLKTQSSFSMYSNLQTEGDRWNHLFMPQALRVFGYQDKVVHIRRSSDPRLQKDAREKTGWVPFEFRRYLGSRPEVSVVYQIDGVVREVTRTGDDAELSTRPNLILRKLLWFRPVYAKGRVLVPH